MIASFKKTRNVGLGAMLMLFIIVCLIPSIIILEIAKPNKDMSSELMEFEEGIEVYEAFNNADDAFNKYVNGELHDVSDITGFLNEAIQLAGELEAVSPEDEKNAVKEFIKSAKLFKVAVFSYAEERRYDPAGSTAIEMEKMALKMIENIHGIMNGFMKDIQADIELHRMNMAKVIEFNQWLSFIAMIVGIIMAVAVIVFMGRALNRPIRQLSEATWKIAEGNLNYRVEVESHDEIGRLADSFNEMAAKLQENERKLRFASKQLLQSEKMSGIGQLTAGIVHEINNPTGFVMSNIETLEGYVKQLVDFALTFQQHCQAVSPDNITQEQLSGMKEHMHKMEKEIDFEYLRNDIFDLIKDAKEGANRIHTIVSNLKTFAHPDTEEVKQTDINAEIEKSVNLVWNELKYKCTLTKEYEEGLPHVNANAGKLEQVFVNLLVNASQAIEKQGEIKIKTYSDDRFVHMEFFDTGAGIPPNKIDNVFEPFFTTKPVGIGTGLGLSIVYSIIKDHQGIIEVKSEVGEGTVFHIKLPISTA